MKRIALLRHGEAEYGKGQSGDFDRKLTSSGKYRVERLALVLAERKFSFDLILQSPAVRTQETAEIISTAIEIKKKLEEKDYYLAEKDAWLEKINDLPEEFDSALVVGHNPGLSTLLDYYVGDYFLNLSPGMLAIVEIEVDSWKAITAGSGVLAEVIQ
ncbi:histidine phosphatase family protein [Echinicola jeungdonensis]|uniref:Histidine phosphatase family protein n=1 Tax=Echinicola jeungdonensis TaxID=709343 RepID=A0ABV5J0G0_9BACT|nr:histidine phosphatase family protein [Echinicola jeungdonensis]MDN3671076.1 histidine phosphatase family protein [Echinicola jeungdonensis]